MSIFLNIYDARVLNWISVSAHYINVNWYILERATSVKPKVEE